MSADVDQTTALAVKHIKALREAFVAGAVYGAHGNPRGPHRIARDEATLRYPLPTVEVPRVVAEKDYGVSYKIDKRTDGLRVLFVKQQTITGGIWKELTLAPHTMDMGRLALIADLFTNPTERIEATE
jgi:hypothetical protein